MTNITPKQEKFAQGIAKGLTQADAYRESYDCEASTNDTIANEAYKLTCDPDIATRITELKLLCQEHLKYDAEAHFRELEHLKDLALTPMGKDGNIDVKAGIKATELKGKLCGLYTEKQDVNANYVVRWDNGNSNPVQAS